MADPVAPTTPKRAISAIALRPRLDANYDSRNGRITLDGEPIGGWVTYGAGRGRGNVGSRTVYGSRIYAHGASIEEEAGSRRVLLDKVARALARAIREGKWPAPAAAEVNAHG